VRPHGQIVIVVAIALTVVLIILAVAVDAGRLYIEQQRLDRSAQAAADAGIGWVSEQMVTQAVARQTEAAMLSPCVPDGEFGESGALCTATPQPAEISHWLNDDDRATLVSPDVQATAESVGREYASRNGLDSSNPAIESLTLVYPYAYDPLADELSYLVRVREKVSVLLVGLIGREFVHLPGEGLSEVPQR
jgi:Putative Flp pilus-assembly TadE/G-like